MMGDRPISLGDQVATCEWLTLQTREPTNTHTHTQTSQPANRERQRKRPRRTQVESQRHPKGAEDTPRDPSMTPMEYPGDPQGEEKTHTGAKETPRDPSMTPRGYSREPEG